MLQCILCGPCTACSWSCDWGGFLLNLFSHLWGDRSLSLLGMTEPRLTCSIRHLDWVLSPVPALTKALYRDLVKVWSLLPRVWLLPDSCSLASLHIFYTALSNTVWSVGLFKSLQQSHSISSQDLLTAMDYCEELLQEIDITNFLLTVCSHVRSFRESHQHFHTHPKAASFQVGSIEQEEEQSSRERGVLVSESRWGLTSLKTGLRQTILQGFLITC